MSCRTGLLLTPKVTKALGNCGYRVPRPLDAALGCITHADFSREWREQDFITLFKNQRKTVVLLLNTHNERESRALWSGLQPYSALNKFAGFNVTNLCACRSGGLGFQRGRPPQWSGPFGKYKNSASCCFGHSRQQQVYTSTKWGARGIEFSPLNTNLSFSHLSNITTVANLFFILYSLNCNL